MTWQLKYFMLGGRCARLVCAEICRDISARCLRIVCRCHCRRPSVIAYLTVSEIACMKTELHQTGRACPMEPLGKVDRACLQQAPASRRRHYVGPNRRRSKKNLTGHLPSPDICPWSRFRFRVIGLGLLVPPVPSGTLGDESPALGTISGTDFASLQSSPISARS